jgi:hypothetical protein
MKGIHLIAFLSLALAVDGNQDGNVLNANHKESNDLNYRMNKALAYLDTIGVEPHKLSLYHENLKSEQDISSGTPRRRIENEEEGESPDNYWFYIINASLALFCVCVAALAAGLTMGLVSQEIIDLKIREVASESDLEREQVRSLVPLLMDHHRLLVTLLLINALANEALPLFLDKIVPGEYRLSYLNIGGKRGIHLLTFDAIFFPFARICCCDSQCHISPLLWRNHSKCNI